MIREILLNEQVYHTRGFALNRVCLSSEWALGCNGQLTMRNDRPGRGSVMVGTEKDTHPRRPISPRERRAGGYHLVGVSLRYPHNPNNIDLSAIEACQRRLCALVEMLNPSKAEVRFDIGKPFSTRYLAAQ